MIPLLRAALSTLLLLPAAHAPSEPAGDVLNKITVGYQGWFSARGDHSPVNQWAHTNLEMWPDTREYPTTYPFNAPNLPDGSPPKMFSSYDDSTVDLHFQWMAESAIDTAALQRFANELTPKTPIIKAQRDGMARKVRAAAEKHRLKFYLMYDLSGWGVKGIKDDWTTTILHDLRSTSSAAYARQNHKPVVALYGIGYKNWPATPAEALDLISFFKDQGCYVIGSVPGQWRTANGDSRPDFEPVYQAFDMLSAWAVGRLMDDYYPTWIKADADYCRAHRIDFQPCVYPGTSFFNTNRSKKNLIPRRNGQFLWDQFVHLRRNQIQTAYIAMFDELNEATSIFKCAEDPSMMPAGQWYLPLNADGIHLSSDFYLRLTKDAAAMLHNQTPLQPHPPTPPTLK